LYNGYNDSIDLLALSKLIVK